MRKLLLGAAVAGGAAFGLRRLTRHAHPARAAERALAAAAAADEVGAPVGERRQRREDDREERIPGQRPVPAAA